MFARLVPLLHAGRGHRPSRWPYVVRARAGLVRCVVTSGLAVAAVTFLRWCLHPLVGDALPYTPFLAAIALTTQREGALGGVMVTVMAIALGRYLFVPHSPALPLEPLITLLVFIGSSALLIWVLEREAAARRALIERDEQIRRSYAERTRLQQELEEARRMESLGRLAGGIAHDFNNLLTVVQGASDLLLQQFPRNTLLESIALAAARASEITKQLLGLGRRQMMVLRPISMNEVQAECLKLCERLLPETIDVAVRSEAEPWSFDGDPALIQQVMLNLVTNARDALPRGGTIRIESANVRVDDRMAMEHPELMPGDYVRLRVLDTGNGMDRPTRERLFEPFYTAKERGSGMGLAVVYGLVKQLHGFIYVESELGRGSVFTIYLPRTHESELASPPPRATSQGQGGLTVLLVEDHPLVRSVLERMLRSLGHVPWVAPDGPTALDMLRERVESRADVLLSDVVMPRMDGYELAERVRREDARVGVVLISGYSDNDVLQRTAGARFALLRKPFSAGELERALASVTGLGGVQQRS